MERCPCVKKGRGFRFIRPILIAAAVQLVITSSQAQKIWVGGVGNFTDGANWNGGTVPQTFDSITVNNGGTVLSWDTVDVANMHVGGGSTYAVQPGILSYFTPDNIYLGTSGTGTLTAGAQSLISAAADLYLGYASGATGVVELDGAYLSPFTTYIGYEGNGTMTLENGSTLQSTTGYVGYLAGSYGIVQLGNSTWKAEDQGLPVNITVAGEGNGTVQATNSLISAQMLTLGNATNTVGTVSSSGGTVTVSQAVLVGNAGTGNFSLLNSANATSTGVILGVLENSTGTLNISDSSWTIDGDLDVGLAGQGTLNATASQLETQEFFLARNPGSTGSVTISGGTTTLHKELHVGAAGSGQFTLEANAILNSDKGNAGFDASANGIINIVDSLWTVTQAVFVGVHGQGTVNISSEGGISSESGYIGQNAGGNGTVHITGEGSWSVTNTLAVGVFGTGNMTVSGGGEANSVWGQIGLQPGSNGTVHLDGGMWTSQNTLTIGEEGNGQFTAVSGSTISAQAIELAASGGISGTLSVSDSTVETEVISPGGGTASLSLNGTRINLRGGTSVLDTLLISGFASNAVVIGSGGLIVDTQGGNAQITTILSGTGNLTKQGAGRLRLTNANTFSGGSVIDGGALELTGNSNLGEGDVTLRNGELRAHTNSTLSGDLNGGIQLISVAGNQTGTFSAATGQTLTLSPLDFLLVAGSTMQAGSAGHTGNVLFAPTGAVALAADTSITVSAGNLTAGNNELAFMTSMAASTSVAAGATLDFQDNLSTGGINALFGAGTVHIGSNSSTTLAVNSGNFSGNISGWGGLVKQSSGTLVLSGQNAFTGGTTLNAGKLVVNGDLSFGLGEVTVNIGGTLGGHGIVGAITLGGGIVAPGSSTGNLTAESFFWEAGTMSFELGPTQSDSDFLNILGDLNGLGTTYGFEFIDAGWSIGSTYNLLGFDNSDIAIDDFFYTNSGGFAGIFDYNNSKLRFTVTAVPEPHTAGLVLLFLASAGFAFRRLKSR